MTREEAIKQLKDNRVMCIISETEPFAIAYDMAIKALSDNSVLEDIKTILYTEMNSQDALKKIQRIVESEDNNAEVN